MDPHTDQNANSSLSAMNSLTHRLTYLISTELSQKESPTIKLIDLNISTLPEEAVELLASVERLSLQKNLLTTLPTSFRTLSKLRYLDLHGNKFTTIPSVLLQCPNLEIVDLSSNEISTLLPDYCQLWCNNVKVLSLKNNKVRSLRDLYPIVSQLKALTILEIDGNEIPQEELDCVTAHVPMNNYPPDEYWLLALQKYFQDFPHFGGHNGTKIPRSAKRMGFINAEESPSAAVQPSPAHDLELMTHSKYNDYFKRLSVLPEEIPNSQQADGSSEARVSHEDLVVGCRKLLFAFTECLQNVRKITSLCADKSVAVNMVSLLYTVRSHIDNLVEVLEQAEDPADSLIHDQLLVNLSTGIISVFKQVIGLLRKNFNSFFRANDICFSRMFYMTLLCSYTEIFNVWNLVVPETVRRKKPTVNARQRSFSVQALHNYKHLPTRQRSNTLQRATNLTQSSSNMPTQAPLISQLPLNSPPNSKNATPSIPSTGVTSSLAGTTNMDSRSDSSPRALRTDSQVHLQASKRNIESQGNDSPNQSNTALDNNIDAQLYHTLRTVVGMVNVVYSQLTQAIQLSAIASTTDEQHGITPAIAAKVKELTETCFQSMELSKGLKARLALITSSDVEQYNTTAEKLTTWECINAFLKSIIAILANTKVIMKDLPILNEVRPNLASLAKITKDVTVILDMSSYKIVSSAQPQQPQTQSTQPPQQHQFQQSQNNEEVSDSHNSSNPYTIITPLSTPSLVTNHTSNPFDQL
ncbi:HDL204Cp [Eremothecium sinecaudum]|uniref:HDL204Cp n=1 Tax=Eremothecium sinecaudum TaxID=45286 RepID=A0A0X8HSC1_9SACH|nr:HDL204Cp [Eremothecium sinecaudum]AMD20540.1 HDL204Cp [Eremothecium sinecaudum]